MSTTDTHLVSMTGIPSVVRQTILLISQARATSVVDEHSLVSDLGFDSLTLAELAFALEDLFGLDAVTPERAMTLRTVGDITALIEAAITNGAAKRPATEDVQALSAQYGHTWNAES